MMWDGDLTRVPPASDDKPDLNFVNKDWVVLYAILEEAHTMANANRYHEHARNNHFFNRSSEIYHLLNKVANLFDAAIKEADAEPGQYVLNNRDWLNIFSIVDEAHSITLTQYNKQHSVTNFWGRKDELMMLRKKLLNLFEGK